MNGRSERRGCAWTRREVEMIIAGGVISALVSVSLTELGPRVIEAVRVLSAASVGLFLGSESLLDLAVRTAIVGAAGAIVSLIVAGTWMQLRRRLTVGRVREVTLDPRTKGSLVNGHVILALLRTSAKILTRSRLAITSLVLLVSGPFLPPVLLFILTFMVVWSVMREFYGGGRRVQEAAEYLVDQLLFSLGRWAESVVEAALGQADFWLRCQIMAFDAETERLVLTHGYHMVEDPDKYLSIAPGQGIAGRAFSQRAAYLGHPADSGAWDLLEEQRAKLRSLSWIMAFPLLGAEGQQPQGVLTIDCDRDLNQDWLDKLYDYSLAMSRSIDVVYSLLWR